MKQKFYIQKSPAEKKLVIQEFAVVQSDLRRRVDAMIQQEDFALLCEQTYDIQNVESSISRGRPALISELRTRHFFPIGLYIANIADKVLEMFALKGDQSAVLVFDDNDFSALSQEYEKMMEPEEEVSLDDDEEIDDILEDDNKISRSPALEDDENHQSYDDDVEY